MRFPAGKLNGGNIDEELIALEKQTLGIGSVWSNLLVGLLKLRKEGDSLTAECGVEQRGLREVCSQWYDVHLFVQFLKVRWRSRHLRNPFFQVTGPRKFVTVSPVSCGLGDGSK